MKLTDVMVNLILKKGILGEFRNLETEFEIPAEEPNKKPIKITVKAEHIQIKLDKENNP